MVALFHPPPLCGPSARSVQATEDLVRKKIRDPSDFEWLKQCRFYWREDRDTVIISIADVDFEYSYEYAVSAVYQIGGRTVFLLLPAPT